MTALIYLAAAVLCAAMGLRAWLEDRLDPVRRAFFQVAVLATLSFVGFLVYLFDGANPASPGKVLHVLSGVVLPFALLGFLERVFRESGASRVLVPLSAVASLGLLGVDIVFWRDVPRASPAEVVAGFWALAGFGLCIRLLVGARNRTDDPVARSRLLYPVVFLGLTTASIAAEQLARAFDYIGEPGAGGAMRMANEIQGPVPPFGALFAVATTYLLLQVVRLSRLLDLHEILARAVTVALAALALVLMQGGLVIWTESLPSYRIHGTFQIFLLAIVFLTVYDPVRARVEAWITAQLNDPGARLERTLSQVEQGLAAVITLDGLDRELLGRLHESGRAPLVSLYLWDPEVAAYRLTRQRGEADPPLIRAIPGGPFTDGLRDEAGATVRGDLARLFRRSSGDREALQHRLQTLEAMDADLTLPLRAGEIILGWVNLKAEPGTDGFSSEEVRRLTSTVDRASVLIQNIRSFEQLKEQGRLAALGEMAAGMAHEIRNPLASIKGAAQYLEAVAEDTDGEETDFLEIIVDEVDRLDGVVTQFLDYSRAVRLRPEPTELPRLVQRALDQMRMGEVPEGVGLSLEVPEPLPPVPVDADRMHQVLLNLLRNAVQAVGESGEVRVRLLRARLSGPGRRGQKAVDLVVQDDGPGIPREQLDKLFIPFFTTRRDGTGLGLPISRRLVEAHDGELFVRSQPGGGSTFTVRLPVEAELSLPA